MTRIKGGRPRDDRATAAILAAGLALFADGGMAAVTMDGVATRAGVGRSTVYRRWRTPEEVVLAALLEVRAEGESGAEDWASWPLDTILDAFADRAAAALVDSVARALLRQVVALPLDHAVARAYRERVVAPRRATFARVLAQAGADGMLAPALTGDGALDLAQEQLEGAMLHRTLLVEPFVDAHEARAWVESLLVALGLRARRDGAGRPPPDTVVEP